MTASKPRIAHLSGPTATIQNTPPLVTSNKARARLGLPPLTDATGEPLRFDALRSQRLALPAKVYVEQFSAHPLESDASELYGPPDGWVGRDGVVRDGPMSDDDVPVYAIDLHPEDGLYPLPYMAVQADGSPWEEEMAVPLGPESVARQGFFPDGSWSFEEIDRLGIEDKGTASSISSRAIVDFYRVAPPAGYTKGLPAKKRRDMGEGDIEPETRGRHFNGYKPVHLSSVPARPSLAKITNDVQAVASSGDYDGVIWTQGSPQVEETAYWMSLLIDTTIPVCGNSAQRPQGLISADGPKNIVDSVSFIASGRWADASGRNRCGVVVIEEQQYFAAREVYKSDARPGNYRATGGHGGIIGQTTHAGAIHLTYLPAYKHTYLSELRTTVLPDTVKAAATVDGALTMVNVAIKDAAGKITEDAIPSVSIVKEGGYFDEEWDATVDDLPVLKAMLDQKLALGRLGGIVAEGLVPYGRLPSKASMSLLERAVFSGIPVVGAGRGAPEGFADPTPIMIAGSNLTSIKARLLLMASLMKLGSLPIAANPAAPTPDERASTIAAVKAYQELFDTH
ncbi:asparaginase domain-containing protein [Salinibacterium hongtaonis]|uniref:Asparaginase n=1 Tax=Homoserinimonas hongtaonis TaxID=2079791 RepID=A0A2U1T1P2_9MICO|nr:asparaginase domain-containing protein [Salinibacterium hongtaonis]AWB90348.1 asparaginase [Salinibacterium hongtaonis]PWB97777.1 asparaginase [Salinibacterium hongtaonis]